MQIGAHPLGYHTHHLPTRYPATVLVCSMSKVIVPSLNAMVISQDIQLVDIHKGIKHLVEYTVLVCERPKRVLGS